MVARTVVTLVAKFVNAVGLDAQELFVCVAALVSPATEIVQLDVPTDIAIELAILSNPVPIT